MNMDYVVAGCDRTLVRVDFVIKLVFIFKKIHFKFLSFPNDRRERILEG